MRFLKGTIEKAGIIAIFVPTLVVLRIMSLYPRKPPRARPEQFARPLTSEEVAPL